MHPVRLAPAGPSGSVRRAWTVAASAALHAAFFALLLGIAARRPPEGAAAPSYELVFDDGGAGQRAPALPPSEPADVPAPEDALPGPPTPSPTSPPAPDGIPSSAPASPPSPAQAEAPAPAEAMPPPPATLAPPALAFAPPAPEPEPAETEAPPEKTPPAVRLAEPAGPVPAPQPAPILPRPPPPLPPMPPRPRPPPPAIAGTFANPMDLSFGPGAPRPAPSRGSVASRAIDLSPGPPRQGPSPSDPYAQIRARNASADWNRGLEAYWVRHRYYPRQAAENGEDGTVVIELTVSRSGRVEAARVVSRSGSQWLDMAAIGTFRDGQLPPFTPEMREDRITFTIPITYYLIR